MKRDGPIPSHIISSTQNVLKYSVKIFKKNWNLLGGDFGDLGDQTIDNEWALYLGLVWLTGLYNKV